jgi:hypothetical protein
LLVHSRTVSVTNQLYLRNYVGNKFALVFWNDDQQFSVGKEEDITGEAKLGEFDQWLGGSRRRRRRVK